MSLRISPRFSSRCAERFNTQSIQRDSRRSLVSLSAIVIVAAYGCASQGSQFGTGGATGTGTGGNAVSTGGSGQGSGGSDNPGSGGSEPTGSGGSSVGSGGDTGSSGGIGGPGSGGSTTGSGGSAGTGGGGPGTGGRIGTGGTSTGSGGSVVGTGGRVGTGGAGTGGGSTEVCRPTAPNTTCHEFFANDNSRNQINYVNEFDPSKNWVAPVGDTGANSPRTIEIVDTTHAMATVRPDGTKKAILVNTNKGYAEFDTVTGRFLTRVSNQTGVTGAARLPNGNTALGTLPAIRIVSPTGALVSSFPLPNPGDDLRAINRNPANGHYWFSKLDDLFEVTETGAQVWTANLGAGTKGYAVWWREGGGAYATTGEPSTVVEINAGKSQVSFVGTKAKFPVLDFFSGFVRLPNGNFVVANWLGHIANPAVNRPHIVELPPQNDRIVWQWGNQTQARQITNVYVVR